MLVNFMSWATLFTFAVATLFSNRYSTRASSLNSHHSVTTPAPYNHYGAMTSVRSIPYSHHNSATMIGSAITNTIYSSKFKVTYSYIRSSTKYHGSMTSESLIRPTGSHTKPLVSYSYIGSPFSTTTISHSANMTKLPTVSSTKASTAHSRYNTTAIVHTAITGTISKSLIQPTNSHTEPLASSSYNGSPYLSTTISHSVNMTKSLAVSLTRASTTYFGHTTTTLIQIAITGTISRSLMRSTGSNIASSISRTYIASPASSVNALHSVSMTRFPTSHSAASIISPTLGPYVTKSTNGSYSHTALPTKSFHVTSCIISGTRCFSSQFSSLITNLPISNLNYHSNSMISVSTSSVNMLKVDEGDVDSPTKAPKDTPTATFGQPRESSTGEDSHVEAASSKLPAPFFLLISDIILLIIVLL